MSVLLALLLAAAQPPSPEREESRGGVFLSPMGEPFRSADRNGDLAGRWFAGADTDHDGALSLAEMQADAGRFFATLDRNGDGEIDPVELSAYEGEVAPEVQLGLQMGSRFGGGGGWSAGRRRGGAWGDGREKTEGRRARGRGDYGEGLEGAGRFSFLNIPEPVISADRDLNRGVSRAEFLRAAGERFLLLDANGDGRLVRAELPPLPERRARGKDERRPQDKRGQ
jgi:EF hand